MVCSADSCSGNSGIKPLRDMREPSETNFWIIGYGNSHRRDDGAGRYVAEQLKLRFGAAPGVHVRSLHQLVPELAEALHPATAIVFVDATVAEGFRGVLWGRIRTNPAMAGMDHGLTPGILLGLIQLLYHRSPPSWMVSLQGSDYGHGDALSRAAAVNAMKAVRQISSAVNHHLRGLPRVSVRPRS